MDRRAGCRVWRRCCDRGRLVFAQNCTLPLESGRGAGSARFPQGIEDRGCARGLDGERPLDAGLRGRHLWLPFIALQSYGRACLGGVRVRDLPFARTDANLADQTGGGRGYYRNVSLVDLWAHAPFLHNNAIGPELCGRPSDPNDEFYRSPYVDADGKRLANHQNVSRMTRRSRGATACSSPRWMSCSTRTGGLPRRR